MDMVIGTFRMNKDYFGRIRKQNPKSELYYKSYHQSNGIIEPETLIQNEIKTELKKILKNYISLNKISRKKIRDIFIYKMRYINKLSI